MSKDWVNFESIFFNTICPKYKASKKKNSVLFFHRVVLLLKLDQCA